MTRIDTGTEMGQGHNEDSDVNTCGDTDWDRSSEKNRLRDGIGC